MGYYVELSNYCSMSLLPCRDMVPPCLNSAEVDCRSAQVGWHGLSNLKLISNNNKILFPVMDSIVLSVESKTKKSQENYLYSCWLNVLGF